MISSLIEKKNSEQTTKLALVFVLLYYNICLHLISKLTIKHILSFSLTPRATAHNNNNLSFSQANKQQTTLLTLVHICICINK